MPQYTLSTQQLITEFSALYTRLIIETDLGGKISFHGLYSLKNDIIRFQKKIVYVKDFPTEHINGLESMLMYVDNVADSLGIPLPQVPKDASQDTPQDTPEDAPRDTPQDAQ